MAFHRKLKSTLERGNWEVVISFLKNDEKLETFIPKEFNYCQLTAWNCPLFENKL
jgi:hypothetical protein